MMYPEAMVNEEAKTSRNKLRSSRMASALFSGARIKMAERYCARIITGILYPLTTENKLMIFIIKSFCFLLNIVLF
jgi:5-keto 4-deoxyuronate isomerase